MQRVSMLLSVLIGLCSVPASPAGAEEHAAASSTPAQLRLDLVQEKDGKFTINRIQLCQVFRPEELGGGATKPFQVKAYMEAPATNVISRDRFVAIGTELAQGLRVGFVSDLIQDLTPSQAMDALQCHTIDEAIGTVDLEVKVVMARAGIQLEITDTGSNEKERRTITWAQLLGQ